MKKYLFFSTLLLILGWGYSQKLTELDKNSNYRLYYELTDEQAEKLYQRKSYNVLEDIDFSQPIDTVYFENKNQIQSSGKSWKTDKRGHFLNVYFEDEEFKYEYLQKRPFQLHLNRSVFESIDGIDSLPVPSFDPYRVWMRVY